MHNNLNNYKIFSAVVTAGSISKAADSLYISQPAISKTISQLEKSLDVKLFDRTSKGVILTAEGHILYDQVTKAFDIIEQGEDEVKRTSELGLGQIRIGVSSTLCKHILLDYLQEFISENPHINFVIDCHSTTNTLSILQQGKIDLGLICETNIPKGFVYKEISDIHDIFVSNYTYLDNLMLRETDESYSAKNDILPVSGNFTTLLGHQSGEDSNENAKGPLSTIELIEKSNLMLLEKNNVTRTHIDSYFANNNIHPHQILEINNMDLLIDFASIGMGVACVVKEFASEQLGLGQIIELPLDIPVKKRTAGFVLNKNKTKSAALKKFLDFCGL